MQMWATNQWVTMTSRGRAVIMPIQATLAMWSWSWVVGSWYGATIFNLDPPVGST